MRPLNIKISAFGPYAGTIEIPMEELGDKGLYLITGDTGAGKTTIFDAICFALFGDASGENRDPSMFRSKYAAPDTPTEVELTFSHRDQTYVVKRNPEYMRPSRRGGGETRQLADATLTMPDGSVVTKVKVVTAKVEEILGINREQFSQIAMLAQGDFLKLLLATTDDRIKIFRDIFKTHNFLTLQKDLNAEYLGLYGQVQDSRKSIEQYIGGIRVDEDDPLSLDVRKAMEGELVSEEVLELLDKLTDKDSLAKKALDAELKEVQEKLSDVNRRLGTAQTVEKALAAMKEASESLNKQDPRVDELTRAFDSARNALSDKSELEKKAHRIEADFAGFDRADKLSKEIEDSRKNAGELKALLTESEKIRTSKSKELGELKDEQAAFKDTGAEIEKIKAESQRVSDSIKQIRELSDGLDKFFEKKDEYEQKQEKYISENNEFIRLNSLYELLEQTFRNAQAGILARDLAEGDACPVCGSTHHPQLAHLEKDVPSEKELQAAKKAAEKARGERDGSAEDLSAKKKALEIQEDDLKKKSKEQLGTEELDGASDAIDRKNAELSELAESLDKRMESEVRKQKRKNLLDKKIPEIEEEIEELGRKLLDLGNRIAADTAKVDANDKELKGILSGLAYKTKAEAKRECDRLLGEAEGLQKAYDKADKDLRLQKNLITELKTKVSENKKVVDESETIDIEKAKEEQHKLIDRQQELIEAGEIVAGRLESNTRTRRNILSKSASMADIEKKLSWVKALSDTANGKLTGKDKVMLETYVQMTYFDRIIRRANLRLVTMSGGQYELVRLKEADNAKSHSGLDLGVIDYYNNTTRSVKTLSGGESFMASLSLALGLSDEVQSSAGGIQIDTMFVDEGFGSLDPDALDMAYKALAGLIEGSRLVGIISHVSELKNKIDRQIVVTKEKSGGSRVELV